MNKIKENSKWKVFKIPKKVQKSTTSHHILFKNGKSH